MKLVFGILEVDILPFVSQTLYGNKGAPLKCKSELCSNVGHDRYIQFPAFFGMFVDLCVVPSLHVLCRQDWIKTSQCHIQCHGFIDSFQAGRSLNNALLGQLRWTLLLKEYYSKSLMTQLLWI